MLLSALLHPEAWGFLNIPEGGRVIEFAALDAYRSAQHLSIILMAAASLVISQTALLAAAFGKKYE